MSKINVCIFNVAEYKKSKISKAISIALPCDNIADELRKIDVPVKNSIVNDVEISLGDGHFDCPPFKAYLEDASVRGEIDIDILNMLACKLSALSEKELDMLALFMDTNNILNSDLEIAIDDFRNAKYYEADGWTLFAELLLEDGYFDKTFGIKYSDLPDSLKGYIDLEALVQDAQEVFVSNYDHYLFMEVGEE